MLVKDWISVVDECELEVWIFNRGKEGQDWHGLIGDVPKGFLNMKIKYIDILNDITIIV